MLRAARHTKILELIAMKEIETQEELCEELNKLNLVVTQATISRDIKELRLYKVAGTQKKYRYAYISDVKSGISQKMQYLFKNCVLAIKCAQNILVVKTLEGNGANAGSVIDKLDYPEVVGSVAGDDTVLVVCQDDEAARNVCDKLNEFLKASIQR